MLLQNIPNFWGSAMVYISVSEKPTTIKKSHAKSVLPNVKVVAIPNCCIGKTVRTK
jgi:hypothetical protein